MVEQEQSTTPQHVGDPLPASLPGILVCEQCRGGIWRAAVLYECSIVYRCFGCDAPVCIAYDTASRSWVWWAL
jgi:hypothetical protein